VLPAVVNEGAVTGFTAMRADKALASATPTAPRGTAPHARTTSETQTSADPFETELGSLP